MKQYVHLLIIGLLLMGSGNLVAQDDSFSEFDSLFEDEGDSSTDTSVQESDNSTGNADFFIEEDVLTLSGSHETQIPVPIHPDHVDYEVPTRVPRQLNELQLRYEALNLTLVSTLYFDFWATEGSDQLEKVDVGMGENYLSVFNDFLTFSLGFQDYAWGSSLGFNPTDHLNARNYWYGMFFEHIPVLSAKLAWYPASFMSLESVYVPLYQDDKSPVDGASVFQSAMASALASSAPPSVTSSTVSVEYDKNNIDINQYQIGERLSFYLPFADFSLSYIYDIDSSFSIEEMNTSLLPTTISADYYLINRRIHRFGLDVIGSISGVTLWLESALNMAEDINAQDIPKMRNHNIEWTAGMSVDTSGTDTSFSFGIQQMGKYILGYRTEVDFTGQTEDAQNERVEYQNYILGQETEGLRLGVVLTSELSVLQDKVVPALKAGYFFPLMYEESSEFRMGSMIVVPSIEFKPLDAFSIGIGADIAYAWISDGNGGAKFNENSRFGKTAESNKVYLEVKYQWIKKM